MLGKALLHLSPLLNQGNHGSNIPHETNIVNKGVTILFFFFNLAIYTFILLFSTIR